VGTASLRGTGFLPRAGQYRSWNWLVLAEDTIGIDMTYRNARCCANDGELGRGEDQSLGSFGSLELGLDQIWEWFG